MVSPPSSFAIDQEAISSTRVLLCEGSGDKNFFQELIKARRLPDFYITHPRDKIDHGGRRGFAQRLRGLRIQPGFEAVIGIIIASDNDRNRNASFQEVRNLIHEADYRAPNHPFVFVESRLTALPLPLSTQTRPLLFPLAEIVGE